MATNQVFVPDNRLSVVCTQPATPVSGDPVLFGARPGVALTDEGEGGNEATKTSVQFDGVWNMSVKGEDGAGNAAIAAGDIIYYDAAATPKLNKDVTNGVRWGYANEAVNSGVTATVEVTCGY